MFIYNIPPSEEAARRFTSVQFIKPQTVITELLSNSAGWHYVGSLIKSLNKRMFNLKKKNEHIENLRRRKGFGQGCSM